MAPRSAMVEIILKYDTWDVDENGEETRMAAAPIVGTDAEGQPVRKQSTMIRREIAERLVNDGKATVPLK